MVYVQYQLGQKPKITNTKTQQDNSMQSEVGDRTLGYFGISCRQILFHFSLPFKQMLVKSTQQYRKMDISQSTEPILCTNALELDQQIILNHQPVTCTVLPSNNLTSPVPNRSDSKLENYPNSVVKVYLDPPKVPTQQISNAESAQTTRQMQEKLNYQTDTSKVVQPKPPAKKCGECKRCGQTATQCGSISCIHGIIIGCYGLIPFCFPYCFPRLCEIHMICSNCGIQKGCCCCYCC